MEKIMEIKDTNIVLTVRYIDKDGNKINKDGLHQYSRVHNYKELLHHIYNSDFNCTIGCKVFTKTKKVVKFVKHKIDKSKDSPDDIISKIADILNIYSERYDIYREYVVYDSKYEDIYSTMKERFSYVKDNIYYHFKYTGTDDVDDVVEERYRLYLDQIISIIHNIGRKELEWDDRGDVLKYSSLKELFETYDVLYK